MADDQDPATPIRTSATYPILRTMAEEEIARLGAYVPFSTTIIARLRAQVALLNSWSPQHPPTDDERRRLIDEIWDTLKAAGQIR